MPASRPPVFAAVGVILSACYMLWLYQRTFYGKASESLSHHMPDLDGREWAAILPLLLLMLWMGIIPRPSCRRSARRTRGF